MEAIRLEKVSKAYGGQELILDDFDLFIKDSTLTTLMGESGCGKTTILRLIAGLEIPDKGKIFLYGKLASRDGQVLIPPHKRHLGFIFQDLALWPHMNVYENIAFGLKIRKDREFRDKVKAIAKEFGIEGLLERFPNELSGGQQQLVAIARSLVVKPRILLMDEPLSSLDTSRKIKLRKFIRTLPDRYGITILYVTHDPHEAKAISDEIIFLK